jgi:hypothetical protein
LAAFFLSCGVFWSSMIPASRHPAILSWTYFWQGKQGEQQINKCGQRWGNDKIWSPDYLRNSRNHNNEKNLLIWMTHSLASHVPADRMFLTDHCDSQPESEKGFVGDKKELKMYHD